MEMSETSVSQCELRCVTKAVVEKCGCHDSYMEPYWDGEGITIISKKLVFFLGGCKFCCVPDIFSAYSTPCNVTTSFLCVPQAIGEKCCS